jgi:hypothetical protein
MAVDVLYDNLGLLSLPPQLQQTCDASSNPAQGQAGLSTSPNCFWSDPANAASGVGFLAGGGLPFTATVPPIPTAAQARLVTSGYIPDQKLPYSETWTLGVQHIFANKYTAEVRYVGTRGIHLPVQQRLNRQARTSPTEFLPTFFTDPGQAAIDALTTTYKQINSNPNYVPAYASAGFSGSNVVGFMPWGSSRYNGLQTQLSRSFNNGLQFQVAYTWSHALDNSTADVFSTYLTPRRPQDFQCFQCDYSDSALDRRQRFTTQILYDVPFLKHSDNWFKKNVVGNWEFAPVYAYQSPEKVTVQSGRDVNGNGDSAGDRTFINPAGVPGTGADSAARCTSALPSGTTCGSSASFPFLVAYVAKSSSAYYVAGGKYSLPNARRNTLSMPVISNLDLTAAKRFNFTETQSFEFQMQALNLLNHAQYLPGNISDVAPLGYTGANVLGMLEPYSQSFNQPKAIFSNHPRGLVLVVKYHF